MFQFSKTLLITTLLVSGFAHSASPTQGNPFKYILSKIEVLTTEVNAVKGQTESNAQAIKNALVDAGAEVSLEGIPSSCE